MSASWGTISSFLLSFVTSLLLCAVVTRVTRRLELLDRPNHRSSHSVATPRLGGVAIVATCLLFIGSKMDLATLAATCVIALLGFADDLRPTPAVLRLSVQIIVAVFFLSTALSSPLPAALLVVACLWLVGAMNVFNFMDGINGIAALQAGAWGLTLYIHALESSWRSLSPIPLTVAGASLGFFVMNARGAIFMGDGGSLTIGFLLASTATRLSDAPSSIMIMCLPFVPFIFDASITLLNRLRRGENIFAAHRTHMYQLLTRAGWSHLRVSSLWTSLALVGAVVSLGYGHFVDAVKVSALALFVLLHLLLAFFVFRKWRNFAHSE